MFARLFGRGSVPQPPAVDGDLAQADLELRAARDRALSGDWRAARDVVTCRHWQVIGYMLGGRRTEARAVLDEIGAFLGSTPAWGYFYHDQSEGFRAAWQWANSAR